MKKLFLAAFVLLLTSMAQAQYKPDEQNSSLKFTIKNLGFGVNGSFSGFDGNINFNPEDLAASNFDVTINAATINTDNSLRDGHLKGDSFFDVKNYPKIRLASSKITGSKSNYQFTGQLTIKGKSKAISFPFTALPVANGYNFKGSFKMNRKDFGVGGTSTVSDELEVNINVITKK